MKRSRWILFLLWIALLAGGLSRLRLDVQVLNLLPSDLPSVEALKLYEERFGQADELIITLHGPDADALESAARAIAVELRQQSNLVQSARWQPPWRENPQEAGELLGYMWLNARPQEVRALAARLSPEELPLALEEVKTALATTFSPEDLMTLGYDPLRLGNVGGSSALREAGSGEGPFASQDGTFRLLLVESARPLVTFPECVAWLGEMRALVSRVAPESVKVGFTGRPAFVAEISSGMEKDVSRSVGGTAVVIAVLFWLAHRSFKPLLLLMGCLALALVTMLALGGLIYGSLNVVSLGFAAILLGLGVDYALLIYQERIAEPGCTRAELRARTQPGILWSAITTSGAFALLNFSGLPGLSQLGSLIAMGVIIAAMVMTWLFLRTVLGMRTRPSKEPSRMVAVPRLAVAASVLLLAGASLVLAGGLPRIDTGTDALRPSDTPAYHAMEAVQANISGTGEPFWLLVRGSSADDLSENLLQIEERLNQAREQRVIASYNLPILLAPNFAHARANQAALAALVHRADSIRETLLAHGFGEASWTLAENVFATWRRALSSPAPFTPASGLSRWALDRSISTAPGGFVALGAVQPLSAGADWRRLKEGLEGQGALVAGWQELGRDLFARVRSRVAAVLGAIFILSLLCLWSAFGSWREVLLSWAALFFGLWCLLAVMKLANWSWNLMNMVALPLLIGAGVDYTIHVQLALKREGGSIIQMWRKVGRALLLSAGTTIAGFGSLYFAGNAGLASLGLVCAAGLAIICFTAIWLLPAWWARFAQSSKG